MAVVPGAQIFASFVLSALGVAFGWIQVNGGRSWWAHFEFTRINIEPIILTNKIEDLREARGSTPIAN